MSDTELQKGWSRSDKWTAAGVVFAAVAIVVSLVVPEIRERLGLPNSSTVSVHLDPAKEAAKPNPQTDHQAAPATQTPGKIRKNKTNHPGVAATQKQIDKDSSSPNTKAIPPSSPPEAESAQITGRVIDKASSSGIMNAYVSIEGRKEFIFTNQLGSFAFALKPPLPAPIHVMVAAEGYTDYASDIRPDQYLQVTLEPEEIILNPSNCMKYDHGLRHFYWYYIFDSLHARRRKDWYQESPTDWNECNFDGTHNHFHVVESHGNLDGNEGVICQDDDHPARVFIPNSNADGAYPLALRYQYTEEGKWVTLANMHVVKK